MGRDSTDPRTFGPLFWTKCNEVADLRFVGAWHLLNLTDAQVDHLLTVFLDSLPAT